MPIQSTLLAPYQADYTIYTNGSAAEETRSRGAAAVITRRPLTQPEVLKIIKTEDRTFSSSYEDEAAAMESALRIKSRLIFANVIPCYKLRL